MCAKNARGENKKRYLSQNMSYAKLRIIKCTLILIKLIDIKWWYIFWEKQIWQLVRP